MRAYSIRYMNTYIHSISTAVPDTVYTQEFVRDFMKKNLAGNRSMERAINSIYSHSGIRKRHSVIREFCAGAGSGPFFDVDSFSLLNPPTGKRNEIYAEETAKLIRPLATKAVKESQFEISDITHVITASCTGFFSPGPDWLVIRELGLPANTPGHHIGFMGCYAAFPALRVAQYITDSQPDAVVLVICTELCTLHLPFTQNMDALLAASLFADGSAAALVSAIYPDTNRPALRLQSLHTSHIPEGEKDMKWTIGNNGFDMTLTTRIPKLIRSHLPAAMANTPGFLFNDPEFDYWAVHPGGRAIIDAVQEGFRLVDAALQPSRDTLSEYGNMSSATILFVLDYILKRAPVSRSRILAMAFGPGLTIESGILERIPASSAASNINDPSNALFHEEA